MGDFAKFLSVNGLKRKEIASFLGVSGAFISQICSGDRPLPPEKLAMIEANTNGWDTSMLKPKKENAYLSMMDRIRRSPREMSEEQLQSAIQNAIDPTEKFLIGYLEKKIKDQDVLIRELYQHIGMLEAKLEFARKGETADAVGGSLSADVI